MIQRHINIEEEMNEELNQVMKDKGQKLSPLINVLLKKYLEEQIQ